MESKEQPTFGQKENLIVPMIWKKQTIGTTTNMCMNIYNPNFQLQCTMLKHTPISTPSLIWCCPLPIQTFVKWFMNASKRILISESVSRTLRQLYPIAMYMIHDVAMILVSQELAVSSWNLKFWQTLHFLTFLKTTLRHRNVYGHCINCGLPNCSSFSVLVMISD